MRHGLSVSRTHSLHILPMRLPQCMHLLGTGSRSGSCAVRDPRRRRWLLRRLHLCQCRITLPPRFARRLLGRTDTLLTRRHQHLTLVAAMAGRLLKSATRHVKGIGHSA